MSQRAQTGLASALTRAATWAALAWLAAAGISVLPTGDIQTYETSSPASTEGGVSVKSGSAVWLSPLLNHGHAAGACLAATAPSAALSAADKALHFTDVTTMAGVNGQHPQKTVRTSPNCMFSTFDFKRRVWNDGALCMPELLTGGAAVGDIDGDGLPDLYVTRMDNIDSLYRNLGNGSFEDVTVAAGLGSTATTHSNGVVFLDVDNDGDEDIYISTVGDTRFYLFINDGSGHFTEEAVRRGLHLTRPPWLTPGEGGLTSSFSIATGDYDMDGYLDVYTTEWFPRLDIPSYFLNAAGVHSAVTCKLMRNLGATGAQHWKRPPSANSSMPPPNPGPGFFEDATWAAGIRPKTGGAKLQADDMTEGVWLSPKHQAQLRSMLSDLLGPDRQDQLDSRIQELNEEAKRMGDNRGLRDKMMSSVFRSLEKDAPLKTLPGAGGATLAAGSAEDSAHLPVHYMEGFGYIGAFQFGSRFVDLDGDGWQDLVISGDFGTSQLLWNARNGSFVAGPLHPLYDHFDNSMGATVGDVNEDGLPDLLFTSMWLKSPQRLQLDKFYPAAGISSNFEGNHLYINEGGRLFKDVTGQAGVKDTGWSWGGILFDMDNDGHLDIAISNGMDDPETTDDDFAVNTPNAAFLRQPRSTGAGSKKGSGAPWFKSAAAELGLADRRDGRAYLEFDFDGDGDLDLFLVNHADYPVLYRNDGGNVNPWLRVQAREHACRDAAGQEVVAAGCTPRHSIGAVVKVKVAQADGDRTYVREIGSAAAFMAQSELTAHFGLGAGVQSVKEVSVYWPRTNATRIIRNVPVRQEIVVRAPAGVDVVAVQDAASSSISLPSCESGRGKIASVTQPTSGTVTVSDNGRHLQYASEPGFVGLVHIHYEAVDEAGHKSAGVLTVNVSAVQSEADATTTKAAGKVPTPTPTAVVEGSSQDLAYPPDVEIDVPMPLTDDDGEVAEVEYKPATGRSRRLGSKRRVYNKQHPHWGVAGTPFIRLAPPSYPDADGSRMPVAATGEPLPSARVVSNALFKQQGSVPSAAGFSELGLSFALFVAHDMASSFPMTHLRRASTAPYASDNIAVPARDATFDPEGKGTVAIPFHRTGYHITSSTSGATTAGRYRQQVNTVSHFLDLHTLYGSDALRAGRLMKPLGPPLPGCMWLQYPRDPSQYHRTYLPWNPSYDPLPNANPYGLVASSLMLAGDERANLHPLLLAQHTMWAREHNRIVNYLVNSTLAAAGLQRGNMTLYTLAHWIVKAEYQAVVWYELLPVLLGPAEYAQLPPYKGYNASVDPSVSNEFATAAFAIWPSGWNDRVHRLNSSYGATVEGPWRLRDAYFSPGVITQKGGFDPLVRGAWATPAQQLDLLFIDDVRNAFLGAKGVPLDYAAVLLQRGRDHGLPSYTRMRAALGLSVPASIQELVAYSGLPAKTQERVVERLSEVYAGRVESVDLLVGGLLEAPVAGGVVGPTFAAIIREQFVRSRDGDRFWFENKESPYVPIITEYVPMEQLKGASLARITESNTALTIRHPQRATMRKGPWENPEPMVQAGISLPPLAYHGSVMYVKP